MYLKNVAILFTKKNAIGSQSGLSTHIKRKFAAQGTEKVREVKVYWFVISISQHCKFTL